MVRVVREPPQIGHVKLWSIMIPIFVVENLSLKEVVSLNFSRLQNLESGNHCIFSQKFSRTGRLFYQKHLKSG